MSTHAQILDLCRQLSTCDDDMFQTVLLSEICALIPMLTEAQLAQFSPAFFVRSVIPCLGCFHNPDVILLSTRALTNLIDLAPETYVLMLQNPDLLPALMIHLKELIYIDVAENIVYFFCRVAKNAPEKLIEVGILQYFLNNLDFFPLPVQSSMISCIADVLPGIAWNNKGLNMTLAVERMSEPLLYLPSEGMDEKRVLASVSSSSFSSAPSILFLSPPILSHKTIGDETYTSTYPSFTTDAHGRIYTPLLTAMSRVLESPSHTTSLYAVAPVTTAPTHTPTGSPGAATLIDDAGRVSVGTGAGVMTNASVERGDMPMATSDLNKGCVYSSATDDGSAGDGHGNDAISDRDRSGNDTYTYQRGMFVRATTSILPIVAYYTRHAPTNTSLILSQAVPVPPAPLSSLPSHSSPFSSSFASPHRAPSSSVWHTRPAPSSSSASSQPSCPTLSSLLSLNPDYTTSRPSSTLAPSTYASAGLYQWQMRTFPSLSARAQCVQWTDVPLTLPELASEQLQREKEQEISVFFRDVSSLVEANAEMMYEGESEAEKKQHATGEEKHGSRTREIVFSQMLRLRTRRLLSCIVPVPSGKETSGKTSNSPIEAENPESLPEKLPFSSFSPLQSHVNVDNILLRTLALSLISLSRLPFFLSARERTANDDTTPPEPQGYRKLTRNFEIPAPEGFFPSVLRALGARILPLSRVLTPSTSSSASLLSSSAAPACPPSLSMLFPLDCNLLAMPHHVATLHAAAHAAAQATNAAAAITAARVAARTIYAGSSAARETAGVAVDGSSAVRATTSHPAPDIVAEDVATTTPAATAAVAATGVGVDAGVVSAGVGSAVMASDASATATGEAITTGADTNVTGESDVRGVKSKGSGDEAGRGRKRHTGDGEARQGDSEPRREEDGERGDESDGHDESQERDRKRKRRRRMGGVGEGDVDAAAQSTVQLGNDDNGPSISDYNRDDDGGVDDNEDDSHDEDNNTDYAGGDADAKDKNKNVEETSIPLNPDYTLIHETIPRIIPVDVFPSSFPPSHSTYLSSVVHSPSTLSLTLLLLQHYTSNTTHADTAVAAALIDVLTTALIPTAHLITTLQPLSSVDTSAPQLSSLEDTPLERVLPIETGPSRPPSSVDELTSLPSPALDEPTHPPVPMPNTPQPPQPLSQSPSSSSPSQSLILTVSHVRSLPPLGEWLCASPLFCAVIAALCDRYLMSNSDDNARGDGDGAGRGTDGSSTSSSPSSPSSLSSSSPLSSPSPLPVPVLHALLRLILVLTGTHTLTTSTHGASTHEASAINIDTHNNSMNVSAGVNTGYADNASADDGDSDSSEHDTDSGDEHPGNTASSSSSPSSTSSSSLSTPLPPPEDAVCSGYGERDVFDSFAGYAHSERVLILPYTHISTDPPTPLATNTSTSSSSSPHVHPLSQTDASAALRSMTSLDTLPQPDLASCTEAMGDDEEGYCDEASPLSSTSSFPTSSSSSASSSFSFIPSTSSTSSTSSATSATSSTSSTSTSSCVSALPTLSLASLHTSLCAHPLTSHGNYLRALHTPSFTSYATNYHTSFSSSSSSSPPPSTPHDVSSNTAFSTPHIPLTHDPATTPSLCPHSPNAHSSLTTMTSSLAVHSAHNQPLLPEALAPLLALIGPRMVRVLASFAASIAADDSMRVAVEEGRDGNHDGQSANGYGDEGTAEKQDGHGINISASTSVDDNTRRTQWRDVEHIITALSSSSSASRASLASAPSSPPSVPVLPVDISTPSPPPSCSTSSSPSNTSSAEYLSPIFSLFPGLIPVYTHTTHTTSPSLSSSSASPAPVMAAGIYNYPSPSIFTAFTSLSPESGKTSLESQNSESPKHGSLMNSEDILFQCMTAISILLKPQYIISPQSSHEIATICTKYAHGKTSMCADATGLTSATSGPSTSHSSSTSSSASTPQGWLDLKLLRSTFNTYPATLAQTHMMPRTPSPLSAMLFTTLVHAVLTSSACYSIDICQALLTIVQNHHEMASFNPVTSPTRKTSPSGASNAIDASIHPSGSMDNPSKFLLPDIMASSPVIPWFFPIPDPTIASCLEEKQTMRVVKRILQSLMPVASHFEVMLSSSSSTSPSSSSTCSPPSSCSSPSPASLNAITCDAIHDSVRGNVVRGVPAGRIVVYALTASLYLLMPPSTSTETSTYRQHSHFSPKVSASSSSSPSIYCSTPSPTMHLHVVSLYNHTTAGSSSSTDIATLTHPCIGLSHEDVDIWRGGSALLINLHTNSSPPGPSASFFSPSPPSVILPSPALVHNVTLHHILSRIQHTLQLLATDTQTAYNAQTPHIISANTRICTPHAISGDLHLSHDTMLPSSALRCSTSPSSPCPPTAGTAPLPSSHTSTPSVFHTIVSPRVVVQLVSHLLTCPWYTAAETLYNVLRIPSHIHTDTDPNITAAQPPHTSPFSCPTVSPQVLEKIAQVSILPHLSLSQAYQLLHLRASLSLLKLTLMGCGWTVAQLVHVWDYGYLRHVFSPETHTLHEGVNEHEGSDVERSGVADMGVVGEGYSDMNTRSSSHPSTSSSSSYSSFPSLLRSTPPLLNTSLLALPPPSKRTAPSTAIHSIASSSSSSSSSILSVLTRSLHVFFTSPSLPPLPHPSTSSSPSSCSSCSSCSSLSPSPLSACSVSLTHRKRVFLHVFFSFPLFAAPVSRWHSRVRSLLHTSINTNAHTHIATQNPIASTATSYSVSPAPPALPPRPCYNTICLHPLLPLLVPLYPRMLTPTAYTHTYITALTSIQEYNSGKKISGFPFILSFSGLCKEIWSHAQTNANTDSDVHTQIHTTCAPTDTAGQEDTHTHTQGQTSSNSPTLTNTPATTSTTAHTTARISAGMGVRVWRVERPEWMCDAHRAQSYTAFHSLLSLVKNNFHMHMLEKSGQARKMFFRKGCGKKTTVDSIPTPPSSPSAAPSTSPHSSLFSSSSSPLLPCLYSTSLTNVPVPDWVLQYNTPATQAAWLKLLQYPVEITLYPLPIADVSRSSTKIPKLADIFGNKGIPKSGSSLIPLPIASVGGVTSPDRYSGTYRGLENISHNGIGIIRVKTTLLSSISELIQEITSKHTPESLLFSQYEIANHLQYGVNTCMIRGSSCDAAVEGGGEVAVNDRQNTNPSLHADIAEVSVVKTSDVDDDAEKMDGCEGEHETDVGLGVEEVADNIDQEDAPHRSHPHNHTRTPTTKSTSASTPTSTVSPYSGNLPQSSVGAPRISLFAPYMESPGVPVDTPASTHVNTRGRISTSTTATASTPSATSSLSTSSSSPRPFLSSKPLPLHLSLLHIITHQPSPLCLSSLTSSHAAPTLLSPPRMGWDTVVRHVQGIVQREYGATGTNEQANTQLSSSSSSSCSSSSTLPSHTALAPEDLSTCISFALAMIYKLCRRGLTLFYSVHEEEEEDEAKTNGEVCLSPKGALEGEGAIRRPGEGPGMAGIRGTAGASNTAITRQQVMTSTTSDTHSMASSRTRTQHAPTPHFPITLTYTAMRTTTTTTTATATTHAPQVFKTTTNKDHNHGNVPEFVGLCQLLTAVRTTMSYAQLYQPTVTLHAPELHWPWGKASIPEPRPSGSTTPIDGSGGANKNSMLDTDGYDGTCSHVVSGGREGACNTGPCRLSSLLTSNSEKMEWRLETQSSVQHPFLTHAAVVSLVSFIPVVLTQKSTSGDVTCTGMPSISMICEDTLAADHNMATIGHEAPKADVDALATPIIPASFLRNCIETTQLPLSSRQDPFSILLLSSVLLYTLSHPLLTLSHSLPTWVLPILTHYPYLITRNVRNKAMTVLFAGPRIALMQFFHGKIPTVGNTVIESFFRNSAGLSTRSSSSSLRVALTASSQASTASLSWGSSSSALASSLARCTPRHPITELYCVSFPSILCQNGSNLGEYLKSLFFLNQTSSSFVNIAGVRSVARRQARSRTRKSGETHDTMGGSTVMAGSTEEISNKQRSSIVQYTPYPASSSLFSSSPSPSSTSSSSPPPSNSPPHTHLHSTPSYSLATRSLARARGGGAVALSFSHTYPRLPTATAEDTTATTTRLPPAFSSLCIYADIYADMRADAHSPNQAASSPASTSSSHSTSPTSSTSSSTTSSPAHSSAISPTPTAGLITVAWPDSALMQTRLPDGNITKSGKTIPSSQISQKFPILHYHPLDRAAMISIRQVTTLKSIKLLHILLSHFLKWGNLQYSPDKNEDFRRYLDRVSCWYRKYHGMFANFEQLGGISGSDPYSPSTKWTSFPLPGSTCSSSSSLLAAASVSTSHASSSTRALVSGLTSLKMPYTLPASSLSTTCLAHPSLLLSLKASGLVLSPHTPSCTLSPSGLPTLTPSLAVASSVSVSGAAATPPLHQQAETYASTLVLNATSTSSSSSSSNSMASHVGGSSGSSALLPPALLHPLIDVTDVSVPTWSSLSIALSAAVVTEDQHPPVTNTTSTDDDNRFSSLLSSASTPTIFSTRQSILDVRLPIKRLEISRAQPLSSLQAWIHAQLLEIPPNISQSTFPFQEQYLLSCINAGLLPGFEQTIPLYSPSYSTHTHSPSACSSSPFHSSSFASSLYLPLPSFPHTRYTTSVPFTSPYTHTTAMTAAPGILDPRVATYNIDVPSTNSNSICGDVGFNAREGDPGCEAVLSSHRPYSLPTSLSTSLSTSISPSSVSSRYPPHLRALSFPFTSTQSILKASFLHEEGFGLGPTLAAYVVAAQQLSAEGWVPSEAERAGEEEEVEEWKERSEVLLMNMSRNVDMDISDGACLHSSPSCDQPPALKHDLHASSGSTRDNKHVVSDPCKGIDEDGSANVSNVINVCDMSGIGGGISQSQCMIMGAFLRHNTVYIQQRRQDEENADICSQQMILDNMSPYLLSLLSISSIVRDWKNMLYGDVIPLSAHQSWTHTRVTDSIGQATSTDETCPSRMSTSISPATASALEIPTSPRAAEVMYDNPLPLQQGVMVQDIAGSRRESRVGWTISALNAIPADTPSPSPSSPSIARSTSTGVADNAASSRYSKTSACSALNLVPITRSDATTPVSSHEYRHTFTHMSARSDLSVSMSTSDRAPSHTSSGTSACTSRCAPPSPLATEAELEPSTHSLVPFLCCMSCGSAQPMVCPLHMQYLSVCTSTDSELPSYSSSSVFSPRNTSSTSCASTSAFTSVVFPGDWSTALTRLPSTSSSTSSCSSISLTPISTSTSAFISADTPFSGSPSLLLIQPSSWPSNTPIYRCPCTDAHGHQCMWSTHVYSPICSDCYHHATSTSHTTTPNDRDNTSASDINATSSSTIADPHLLRAHTGSSHLVPARVPYICALPLDWLTPLLNRAAIDANLRDTSSADGVSVRALLRHCIGCWSSGICSSLCELRVDARSRHVECDQGLDIDSAGGIRAPATDTNIHAGTSASAHVRVLLSNDNLHGSPSTLHICPQMARETYVTGSISTHMNAGDKDHEDASDCIAHGGVAEAAATDAEATSDTDDDGTGGGGRSSASVDAGNHVMTSANTRVVPFLHYPLSTLSHVTSSLYGEHSLYGDNSLHHNNSVYSNDSLYNTRGGIDYHTPNSPPYSPSRKMPIYSTNPHTPNHIFSNREGMSPVNVCHHFDVSRMHTSSSSSSSTSPSSQSLHNSSRAYLTALPAPLPPPHPLKLPSTSLLVSPVLPSAVEQSPMSGKGCSACEKCMDVMENIDGAVENIHNITLIPTPTRFSGKSTFTTRISEENSNIPRILSHMDNFSISSVSNALFHTDMMQYGTPTVIEDPFYRRMLYVADMEMRGLGVTRSEKRREEEEDVRGEVEETDEDEDADDCMNMTWSGFKITVTNDEIIPAFSENDYSNSSYSYSEYNVPISQLRYIFRDLNCHYRKNMPLSHRGSAGASACDGGSVDYNASVEGFNGVNGDARHASAVIGVLEKSQEKDVVNKTGAAEDGNEKDHQQGHEMGKEEADQENEHVFVRHVVKQIPVDAHQFSLLHRHVTTHTDNRAARVTSRAVVADGIDGGNARVRVLDSGNTTVCSENNTAEGVPQNNMESGAHISHRVPESSVPLLPGTLAPPPCLTLTLPLSLDVWALRCALEGEKGSHYILTPVRPSHAETSTAHTETIALSSLATATDASATHAVAAEAPTRTAMASTPVADCRWRRCGGWHWGNAYAAVSASCERWCEDTDVMEAAVAERDRRIQEKRRREVQRSMKRQKRSPTASTALVACAATSTRSAMSRVHGPASIDTHDDNHTNASDGDNHDDAADGTSNGAVAGIGYADDDHNTYAHGDDDGDGPGHAGNVNGDANEPIGNESNKYGVESDEFVCSAYTGSHDGLDRRTAIDDYDVSDADDTDDDAAEDEDEDGGIAVSHAIDTWCRLQAYLGHTATHSALPTHVSRSLHNYTDTSIHTDAHVDMNIQVPSHTGIPSSFGDSLVRNIDVALSFAERDSCPTGAAVAVADTEAEAEVDEAMMDELADISYLFGNALPLASSDTLGGHRDGGSGVVDVNACGDGRDTATDMGMCEGVYPKIPVDIGTSEEAREVQCAPTEFVTTSSLNAAIGAYSPPQSLPPPSTRTSSTSSSSHASLLPPLPPPDLASYQSPTLSPCSSTSPHPPCYPSISASSLPPSSPPIPRRYLTRTITRLQPVQLAWIRAHPPPSGNVSPLRPTCSHPPHGHICAHADVSQQSLAPTRVYAPHTHARSGSPAPPLALFPSTTPFLEKILAHMHPHIPAPAPAPTLTGTHQRTPYTPPITQTQPSTYSLELPIVTKYRSILLNNPKYKQSLTKLREFCQESGMSVSSADQDSSDMPDVDAPVWPPFTRNSGKIFTIPIPGTNISEQCQKALYLSTIHQQPPVLMSYKCYDRVVCNNNFNAVRTATAVETTTTARADTITLDSTHTSTPIPPFTSLTAPTTALSDISLSLFRTLGFFLAQSFLEARPFPISLSQPLLSLLRRETIQFASISPHVDISSLDIVGRNADICRNYIISEESNQEHPDLSVLRAISPSSWSQVCHLTQLHAAKKDVIPDRTMSARNNGTVSGCKRTVAPATSPSASSSSSYVHSHSSSFRAASPLTHDTPSSHTHTRKRRLHTDTDAHTSPGDAAANIDIGAFDGSRYNCAANVDDDISALDRDHGVKRRHIGGWHSDHTRETQLSQSTQDAQSAKGADVAQSTYDTEDAGMVRAVGVTVADDIGDARADVRVVQLPCNRVPVVSLLTGNAETYTNANAKINADTLSSGFPTSFSPAAAAPQPTIALSYDGCPLDDLYLPFTPPLIPQLLLKTLQKTRDFGNNVTNLGVSRDFPNHHNHFVVKEEMMDLESVSEENVDLYMQLFAAALGIYNPELGIEKTYPHPSLSSLLHLPILPLRAITHAILHGFSLILSPLILCCLSDAEIALMLRGEDREESASAYVTQGQRKVVEVYGGWGHATAIAPCSGIQTHPSTLSPTLTQGQLQPKSTSESTSESTESKGMMETQAVDGDHGSLSTPRVETSSTLFNHQPATQMVMNMQMDIYNTYLYADVDEEAEVLATHHKTPSQHDSAREQEQDSMITLTSSLSSLALPQHPHHLSLRSHDFSASILQSYIQLKPPYTVENKTISALFALLSSFTPQQQHDFLVFATGLPSLPINGLSALHPPLNIVRVEHKQPHTILPSAMTCTRTLKLPDYGDADVLKRRLLQAIAEAGDTFLLS